MVGVLTGFAIIGFVIAVGYVVGRLGILGESAPYVLSRIVFFVLSPCLLFTVLASADSAVLFSTSLAVSAISSALVFAIFAIVAFGIWRRPLAEGLIGTASAGWINANNIGLPVAVYVLGNPAVVAPVIMLQLIVFTPILLTVLDIQTGGKVSVWRRIGRPFANPVIIGSLLGALVSITGFDISDEVMAPFELIGGAAVPLVLLSFGMSLHGRRALAPGPERPDVILATALKLLLMPLIAWIFGHFVFDLDAAHLFAVVVLSALPTAQNVFNYAQRYERGVTISRDAVLLTTIGAVPVLVVVAALLS